MHGNPVKRNSSQNEMTAVKTMHTDQQINTLCSTPSKQWILFIIVGLEYDK